MIRRAIRWILGTLFGLFGLILLVILLLLGALFTNKGLNVVLWGAEKALPQLQVGRTEGAFFPKFSLYDVSFSDESLNVDLTSRELTLAINANCFLTPSVCVEQLKIDGLSFALTELPPPNEEEQEEPTEPLTEISLPIPMHINGVELTDIDLNILGNKIDWQHFSTRMEMSGRTLTIHPTLFEDVNLELAQTPQEQAVVEEPEDPEKKAQAEQAIALPDVLIPLEIDLKQFDLNRFVLKGEAPLEVTHLGVSANVDEYSVEVRGLNLDMPQATLDLTSELELRGDYPLVLDASALVKQTDLSGQKLVLSARGSVADLELEARASEVIGAVLQGRLHTLDPDLPFDIALSEGALQWPLRGSAEYTVDLAALEVKGSLKGYQLGLKTEVDGSAIPKLDLEVSGEGDLSQVELETISLKTLGGEVTGQVMANWQDPINWRATLGLDNIQPGLEWQQAEGNISGSLTTTGQLLASGGWQVELPILDIEGVVRDYPLDIEGELSASDQAGKGDIKIVTPGLEIRHGPNGVHVSGNLDKEWNIDTVIHVPELDKSIPDLKGKIDGEVSLRGALAEPKIVADLGARQMAYTDLATVTSINISADISPLPSPSGQLNLYVGDLHYQDKVVDSIDLAFAGSRQEHELSLTMLSELLKASMHINGGVEEKPDLAWRGTLDKVEFSSEQGRWMLDQKVGLAYLIDQQIATMEAHCWNQASSKVCLTEDLTAGASGEAHLEVRNFAFDQVAMFVPQGTELHGEVNVTASASWAPDKSPEVDVSVMLPKGKVVQQVEVPVELGWENIALNAGLHNDALAADWLLDITDNGDIKGNLDVADVRSTHQALDGRLLLQQINLDMLQPLLGEFGRVDAEINSDIKVSGPVTHPQVNGELVISDLVAQGDITPVEVRTGQFEVLFSGYDAQLNADIETPDGVLQLDGDASWRDLTAWSTNIRVFAESLKADVPPMVKIEVKPDMTIAVTPKLARIDGDIYLPWGRITVEELPPSAVGVSSDEVILNKDLQPEEENTELPMVLEVGVNIHIGDDFRLSAFGLRGGLIGKLNVTQKDKGPFIVGEIEIDKGVYRSFGQDLIIEEGKVLMNGPADQPYLAIKAIRNPDNTQDDVVAGIRVTGPANEPEIEVFSEPAMPQQNALSYLLRGQDIEGSTGGSAMTTALIGLSLAKSGRVVGEIGETFGVSDLQLDTAGSGDESQVTVSGYITPDLQLKYGVGIFDSFGEFTVRYRLLTDLYLEAVSGMDSAVDLLYQFEFD